MKKLFSVLAVFGMMTFGVNYANAQDNTEETTEVAQEAAGDEANAEDSTAMEVAEEAPVEEVAAPAPVKENAPEVAESKSMHQILKEKFIEGGPGFMAIVLICLIIGLALCIERIIYLNMATTNTNKLLEEIEAALKSGGVNAAKEVCRNTSGPIASIFYQGLSRSDEGVEIVEKSVIAYGGVQMGLLEKGLSWIQLFIALAPMLGFMGTVIGMIGAFDAIAAENNISPAIVADGIKVALLTTVFGLIVAIILQIFYNYIVAKVDSLVNQMEDASISLVDVLVKHEVTKN